VSKTVPRAAVLFENVEELRYIVAASKSWTKETGFAGIYNDVWLGYYPFLGVLYF
jgi:hypothetical protein